MLFIASVQTSMLDHWAKFIPLVIFVAWNCVPAAIGIWALSSTRMRTPLRFAGALGFALVATILPALFHFAWIIDWQGTASGSSTSALAFIFVPPWTLVFGCVAALAAAASVVAVRFVGRRGGRRAA